MCCVAHVPHFDRDQVSRDDLPCAFEKDDRAVLVDDFAEEVLFSMAVETECVAVGHRGPDVVESQDSLVGTVNEEGFCLGVHLCAGDFFCFFHTFIRVVRKLF